MPTLYKCKKTSIFGDMVTIYRDGNFNYFFDGKELLTFLGYRGWRVKFNRIDLKYRFTSKGKYGKSFISFDGFLSILNGGRTREIKSLRTSLFIRVFKNPKNLINTIFSSC